VSRLLLRSGISDKRLLLAVCLVCALALSAAAAPAGWKFSLEGVDLTAAAAPIECGDQPCVNLLALAPALGLEVSVEGEELRLTDSAGREWEGPNGAASLESAEKSLPLTCPLLLQGGIAYLPVEAVAELAGLHLDLDREARRASLGRPRTGEAPLPEGWQLFSLEKTAEEKAELASEQAAAGNGAAGGELRLPPAHDRLTLGLGVGYVQGADWGLEVSGSGRVRGAELDLGGLVTVGHRGLRAYSGRLSLLDREMGWGAEAGDLFSELWGLVPGLRYSRQMSERRWSSVSTYFKTRHSPNREMLLAYEEELKLPRQLSLGTEVTSDGSFLVKGRFRRGPLSLYAYRRAMREDSREGVGAFASWELGKGVSLYGGLAHSGRGLEAAEWRNVSVRFPLRREVNLILEHAENDTSGASEAYDAAMLTLPLGPVRLLTRYQLRDSTRRPEAAAWLTSRHREFMMSAFYLADQRLSLDYQVSLRWREDGLSERWEQLVSTYRLSPRTRLQAFSAFPHLADRDQLRLRLDHELRENLSFVVDYGLLMPFQGVGVTQGERGFKVMLRKRWRAATPARGGEVSGRVIDQIGQPLAQAGVSLNGYRTMTDARGGYQFRHLPSGTYQLRLEEASLPADYRAADGVRQLTVNPKTRQEVDLRVTPLNAITGTVYCDLDGDGRLDVGEGVGKAVLHLDGFVTASNDDGSFGFYNLEPGEYTIRLDAERLPAGLLPVSPPEVSLRLPPDRPVTGVSFLLARREKEIIFQELPG
jgi:protocatechuate 3,4-dioxygenase beta subunit